MIEPRQQSWKLEKAWADGHLEAIEEVVRRVIGKIVSVTPSSFQRDANEAIDYDIVVSSGAMSCRIRRAATCRWRDLTMTSQRPSNARPEATKIAQGDVRWYLYAWAEAGGFVDWMFVDLDVVRRKGLIQRAESKNHARRARDGSKFLFIPASRLERADAIVDASRTPMSSGGSGSCC